MNADTLAARAEAAFEAYNAHLSSCRVCNDRIVTGSDFCDEGKRIGDAYVAAYDESRAARATSGETS